MLIVIVLIFCIDVSIWTNAQWLFCKLTLCIYCNKNFSFLLLIKTYIFDTSVTSILNRRTFMTVSWRINMQPDIWHNEQTLFTVSDCSTIKGVIIVYRRGYQRIRHIRWCAFYHLFDVPNFVSIISFTLHIRHVTPPHNIAIYMRVQFTKLVS